LFFVVKGTEVILLGFHVDDVISTGPTQWLDEILQRIKSQNQINETAPEEYLGWEISKTESGYSVRQEKYVEKILVKYGMEDCIPVSNPCLVGQDLDLFADSKFADKKAY